MTLGVQVTLGGHGYGLQLTPNMGSPKRLSIAHWKALGESYLLSINQVRGRGVV